MNEGFNSLINLDYIGFFYYKSSFIVLFWLKRVFPCALFDLAFESICFKNFIIHVATDLLLVV